MGKLKTLYLFWKHRDVIPAIENYIEKANDLIDLQKLHIEQLNHQLTTSQRLIDHYMVMLKKDAGARG